MRFYDVDREKVIDAKIAEWQEAEFKEYDVLRPLAEAWNDAYAEAYDAYMEQAGDFGEEEEDEVKEAAEIHAMEAADEARDEAEAAIDAE